MSEPKSINIKQEFKEESKLTENTHIVCGGDYHFECKEYELFVINMRALLKTRQISHIKSRLECIDETINKCFKIIQRETLVNMPRFNTSILIDMSNKKAETYIDGWTGPKTTHWRDWNKFKLCSRNWLDQNKWRFMGAIMVKIFDYLYNIIKGISLNIISNELKHYFINYSFNFCLNSLFKETVKFYQCGNQPLLTYTILGKNIELQRYIKNKIGFNVSEFNQKYNKHINKKKSSLIELNKEIIKYTQKLSFEYYNKIKSIISKNSNNTCINVDNTIKSSNKIENYTDITFMKSNNNNIGYCGISRQPLFLQQQNFPQYNPLFGYKPIYLVMLPIKLSPININTNSPVNIHTKTNIFHAQ